jgi:prolyl oligopeptidase
MIGIFAYNTARTQNNVGGFPLKKNQKLNMSYKDTQKKVVFTRAGLLFAALLALLAGCKHRTLNGDGAVPAYPSVFRDSSVVDDYFGEKVQDPYRWLEDPNAPRTHAWVEAQNRFAYDYLDRIPFRDAVHDRLEELWNFERFGLPEKKGNKLYFYKNNGLQNQDVLYEQDGTNGGLRKVLDPNTFSKDGTKAIDTGSSKFSKDGHYYAYAVADAGSDWRTIFVMDLAAHKPLRDTVAWAKFTDIAWEGNGFYYSRYAMPEKGREHLQKNEFQQVFYHKIGTPQSEDVLVFADRQHPQRNFSASTTTDERFLIVSGSESTSGNSLYFKDLKKNEAAFSPIIDNFDNDHTVIDNLGESLLVLTNKNAPNKRLVLVNAGKPSPSFWQEVIPERADVLSNVRLVGGKILATYIHNASSQLKVFELNGQFVADVPLPGIGTIEGVRGNKDDPQAFYAFVSFTQPTTIFTYDLSKKESEVFKSPNIGFQSDDYETKQVVYESYDGTKIPLFITAKKGMVQNGANPTLLYGYGGFDISILPSFKVENTVLLENGGIFAVANIRGGGEFGESWHQGGILDKKQNVFDDFQAAAEYLIKEKYTSPAKLAIEGRSNGGLLVGACITQRPDLYKVALPAVGVMDMLRYHKFTIGWAWATDYGTSEIAEQYKFLRKYSPLHNVRAGQKYPATLITTADHDDRVVPAHSFKFASELQYKNEGENPILIRIDTSAGHGAGKPTLKKIEEAADIVSFMLYNLGVAPTKKPK